MSHGTLTPQTETNGKGSFIRRENGGGPSAVPPAPFPQGSCPCRVQVRSTAGTMKTNPHDRAPAACRCPHFHPRSPMIPRCAISNAKQRLPHVCIERASPRTAHGERDQTDPPTPALACGTDRTLMASRKHLWDLESSPSPGGRVEWHISSR